VSRSGRVASSYSCPVCCPDSGPAGHFDPNAYGLSVDGFVYTNAHGDYYDCYYNYYLGSVSFSHIFTYNTNIATVDGGGQLNGIAVGSTDVEGDYTYLEWYNDGMDCYQYYGNGSDTAPVDTCTAPTSETTTSGGWADSEGNPTIHKWIQTLAPSTTNFAGRVVSEANPGGGQDTCHFSGSAISPFNAVTGGSWTVDSNNSWGPDYVGWLPSAVTYYRAQGRAPCEAQIPQRMDIFCNTRRLAYSTTFPSLHADIQPVVVTSRRAEGQTSRTWP